MSLSQCEYLRKMAAVVACGALLGATGCGPSTGNIKGKVTYNGAAVGGGNVTFFTEDGKGTAVSARIQEDGSYSIDKVPAGPVKISVETNSVKNAASNPFRERASKPPKDANQEGVRTRPDMGNASPGKYTWIPEEFADKDGSMLTYTVVGGDQEHDIPMTGPKDPPKGSAPKRLR